MVTVSVVKWETQREERKEWEIQLNETVHGGFFRRRERKKRVGILLNRTGHDGF